jgi:hypothetical protein
VIILVFIVDSFVLTSGTNYVGMFRFYDIYASIRFLVTECVILATDSFCNMLSTW